jgi:hypothetical protein
MGWRIRTLFVTLIEVEKRGTQSAAIKDKIYCFISGLKIKYIAYNKSL